MCFLAFFSTGSPFNQTMEPPAASIFWRAVFEKPWAETTSFFVRSPLARILMSVFVFLADGGDEGVGRHLGAGLEAVLGSRRLIGCE